MRQLEYTDVARMIAAAETPAAREAAGRQLRQYLLYGGRQSIGEQMQALLAALRVPASQVRRDGGISTGDP